MPPLNFNPAVQTDMLPGPGPLYYLNLKKKKSDSEIDSVIQEKGMWDSQRKLPGHRFGSA